MFQFLSSVVSLSSFAFMCLFLHAELGEAQCLTDDFDALQFIPKVRGELT